MCEVGKVYFARSMEQTRLFIPQQTPRDDVTLHVPYLRSQHSSLLRYSPSLPSRSNLHLSGRTRSVLHQRRVQEPKSSSNALNYTSSNISSSHLASASSPEPLYATHPLSSTHLHSLITSKQTPPTIKTTKFAPFHGYSTRAAATNGNSINSSVPNA